MEWRICHEDNSMKEKQRPLGIPTVVDRVIQQAVAQELSRGYERYFSEYSYGFSTNRDCHKAIEKVLEYLNEGCEWVVDLDIEKYFDEAPLPLAKLFSPKGRKCRRLNPED